MPNAEPREIDMTRPTWGHNFSVIDWPKGELFVWATPGPHEGDVLTVQGKEGPIRAKITKVKWMINVDDMYRISVAITSSTPEGTPNA